MSRWLPVGQSYRAVGHDVKPLISRGLPARQTASLSHLGSAASVAILHHMRQVSVFPSPPSSPLFPLRSMDYADWMPLLLAELREAATEPEYLYRVLKKMADLRLWQGGAVVQSQPPDWQVVAAVPLGGAVPIELAADALDSGTSKRAEEWIAVPMRPAAAESLFPPTALVIRDLGGRDWTPVATTLAEACLLVRQSEQVRRRATRLELLLEMTREWAQTERLETLLHRMAEGATRLLECDRATIFLWDRRQHLLIGRPALGMENNELRIPDDAGVVGRVVRTGEPQRVDRHDDRRAIHAAVDKQSGYQTETILCVPLVSPAGEVLGAFELLNKRQGNFTADDQAELSELALAAQCSGRDNHSDQNPHR